MSDYIKLFDTQQDQEDFIFSEDYKNPHVSCTADGKNLRYGSDTFTDKELENFDVPFTIVMLEAGELAIRGNARYNAVETNMQYRVNDGTGQYCTPDTNSIQVNVDDEITFKPTGIARASNNSGCLSIASTAKHKALGNIMSLYSENFSNIESFTETGYFRDLFEQDYGLEDVSGLVLSLKQLTSRCYCYMFLDCINLKNAPSLPATTLAEGCYSYMFEGCRSLKIAPKLPATNLAESCYMYMFHDCVNLEIAPDLPATVLTEDCYQYMFAGCRSLKYPPKELLATEAEGYCYGNMFSGCNSLRRSPKIGISSISDNIPNYSRTNCFSYMFYNCEMLNYIYAPYFTADIYSSSFMNNCAERGTFVISSSVVDSNGNETLFRNRYNIPEKGTIKIENI